MLTEQALADVYTLSCYAMTELGAERTPLFLARLTLLLMKEAGDEARIRAAIEQARTGLM